MTPSRRCRSARGLTALAVAAALLAACLADDDTQRLVPRDSEDRDATVEDGGEDAEVDVEPEDPDLDDDAVALDDLSLDDASAGDVVPDAIIDQGGPSDAPIIYDSSDETTIRGAMTLAHAATVEGQGTNRIGAISVSGSVGHLTRASEVPALVYYVQDWPEFSYTLYHVLAPTNDTLNVLYFYCGNADSTSLDLIWHESYGDAMNVETGVGTCSAQMDRVRAEVSLPRLHRLPSANQLVTGFTVYGDAVTIDETGGSLRLDGRRFDVYPFETVDCTTECSEDPEDGWWELHAVLDDTANGDKCFAIFYLELAIEDYVVISHGFCLDSLTPLSGVAFEATWTAPTSRKSDLHRLPAGPRHPTLGYVLRPRPEW